MSKERHLETYSISPIFGQRFNFASERGNHHSLGKEPLQKSQQKFSAPGNSLYSQEPEWKDLIMHRASGGRLLKGYLFYKWGPVILRLKSAWHQPFQRIKLIPSNLIIHQKNFKSQHYLKEYKKIP